MPKRRHTLSIISAQYTRLLFAHQDFENLTDSVKSIIKRQTAYFTPQIDSVSKYGKDTLLVSYTIVKNDPADSIATKGADQLIKSCLSIVKEDEDWKIAALNRL